MSCGATLDLKYMMLAMLRQQGFRTVIFDYEDSEQSTSWYSESVCALTHQTRLFCTQMSAV